MAKRKSPKPKRPIEQYDHKGKDRTNNPPVGLVTPDSDKDLGKKSYSYDLLSLIKYWIIYPNYDGVKFKNKCQNYRGNVGVFGDSFRAVSETILKELKRSGKRKICVKAVDLYRYESAVVEGV